jgi:spore germination protein KC
MKKTIVSIIIALSMLLTGCWDLVEPEKLGLVTLMGIDSSDGQIKVLIHEMSQQKQSSGTQMESTGGSAPIKLHEATAPTISEAIQKISASDFRRTYFSHISAIILSEELVSSIGITPIVNYFERNPEIRSAAWLLIAKEGQFDRVFSISTSVEPGASTGMIIEGIIKNRPALFFSVNTMIDFLNLFWEKGSEPYTSGISLIEIPAANAKQEAGATPEESN